MMRCSLVGALASLALHGAVIRGTVVENQTGKALSRASVALQPIAGTPGNPLTAITNSYGGFEFGPLAAGAYVLKASRRGFISTEYGQKQWNSAGSPIVVTGDASPFLTIRLPRYGAITGTIVDENDVGLPQHDVVAYRFTQPPQLVTRASTDDRGVYRISGLEPGVYVVRTAAKQDETAEYSPTFSQETLQLEQAQTVPVYLDQDSRDVNVRPAPGKLLTLSGVAATSATPGGSITVTLASDMGRQSTVGPAPLPYRFSALSPGLYELYAEAPENMRVGAKLQSAHAQFNVHRDTVVNLSLEPIRETQFEVTPGQAGNSSSMQILARRKDLAGVYPAQALRLTNDRAALALGRFELLLTPPPGYYVSGFSGPSRGTGARGRPDGWNEIGVNNNYSMLRVSLSPGPGALHGIVKTLGDIVAGAPVYLEAYDPNTRQRMTDLRATRTDLRGVYRFEGLAPGAYRVLATFEWQMPDSAAMDLAGALSAQIEAHGDLQMDLELYAGR